MQNEQEYFETSLDGAANQHQFISQLQKDMQQAYSTGTEGRQVLPQQYKKSGKNSLNRTSSPVLLNRKRKKVYVPLPAKILPFRNPKRQPTLRTLFQHPLTEKQLDKYLLYLGETYPPKHWPMPESGVGVSFNVSAISANVSV